MAIPTHFYRYRSLSGDNLKWVCESITNSAHKYSNPLEFNDPFDCRPTFKYAGTNAELIKYCEGVLKNINPELSRDTRRIEARKLAAGPLTDPRTPAVANKFSVLYRKMYISKAGVLCLSEVGDHILMWSHYADSHRGVCLIFDGSQPYFESAQPVIYKQIRPSVNPIRQHKEQMLDHALFTKSDHWAYEKEWRLLEYRKGPGIYYLPTKALIGVILGAEIRELDELAIRQATVKAKAPPQLHRAILSTTEFKLDIVPA